ncbi:MAG TPA: response regulator [Burkholderiales bacterium]|nr:response regulator [Burkholderiales bacterium]
MSQSSQTIHVLVIDDDEIAREYMCDVLRKAGFNVEDMPSSIGVTNRLVRDRCDVVVIDVMMPAIRGDKLAGLLRKNSQLKELAVVMVSGAPREELEQLGPEIDPDRVVNKGNVRTKLVDAVVSAYRERATAK